jgi:protease-4
MKIFLRSVFTFPWRFLNGLRQTLANLFMLMLVGFALTLLVGYEEKASIPEHAVLLVQPGQALVEQRSYNDPFMELLQPTQDAPAETVLYELTSSIRWAAQDPRIEALVLNLNHLAGSDLAKLDAVGQALIAFKASGKRVLAFGDNYTQSQYYLASHADRVYMHPMGTVQLQGFAAYQSYLKDMLDQLAVNVHVFRAGQFKSFIEPFVRNDMSDEARENLQQWVDEQWTFYTLALQTNRKLDSNAIDNYIETQDLLLADHSNSAAQLAVAYGLVDELASRNDMTRIIDALAPSTRDNTVDADTYFAQEYRKHTDANPQTKQSRIAVIHASGPIVDGEQPPGYVGAETLIGQIREARKDEGVVSIVLRIDSPGGSAFASELIREELVQAQADGKPVVASMSGVAASGGYWIASSADEVWASPMTITGSIGVFGVFPTLEETLSRLGIHSDGYSTSPLAASMQLDRPLDPLVARVLQQGVDFTYQEFLNRVAAGRNSKPDIINQVAQGRVWTGAHAMKINLVDHAGTLDEAIAAAARLAKVEQYRVDVIKPELTPFESLMEGLTARQSFLSGWLQHSSLKSALPLLSVLTGNKIEGLPLFNDPNHVYATCWECRHPLR